jgi:hypothetical protein
MKRFLALCPLLAATACSAGGGGTTPSANQPVGATVASVAMLSDANASSISRIYVAQYLSNDIEEFGPKGNLLATSPASCNGPQNMVFDQNENLLVACLGSRNVLSFTKDLVQNGTVVQASDYLVGLAVGPAGKIFTTLYQTGNVVAYDANGQQTTPTIAGSGNITYVAVDAQGKIYVTDAGLNTLKTYKADGTPTTPTITAGLNGPADVVVDKNGKIYVCNDGSGSITTYNADGTPATPTIAVKTPHGIAVAANGDISVTNTTTNTAQTFSPTGKLIKPTIAGLNQPTGIAVLSSP